jgi:hypothetical protein
MRMICTFSAENLRLPRPGQIFPARLTGGKFGRQFLPPSPARRAPAIHTGKKFFRIFRMIAVFPESISYWHVSR